jgi:hypothetical protein
VCRLYNRVFYLEHVHVCRLYNRAFNLEHVHVCRLYNRVFYLEHVFVDCVQLTAVFSLTCTSVLNDCTSDRAAYPLLVPST